MFSISPSGKLNNILNQWISVIKAVCQLILLSKAIVFIEPLKKCQTRKLTKRVGCKIITRGKYKIAWFRFTNCTNNCVPIAYCAQNQKFNCIHFLFKITVQSSPSLSRYHGDFGENEGTSLYSWHSLDFSMCIHYELIWALRLLRWQAFEMSLMKMEPLDM